MNRVELAALNGSETAQKTSEVYSEKTAVRGLDLKTNLEIYAERAKFLRDKKESNREV